MRTQMNLQVNERALKLLKDNKTPLSIAFLRTNDVMNDLFFLGYKTLSTLDVLRKKACEAFYRNTSTKQLELRDLSERDAYILTPGLLESKLEVISFTEMKNYKSTMLIMQNITRSVKKIRIDKWKNNDYIKAIGGTVGNVFVGGVMASIMPEDIFNETGVWPVQGLLHSPKEIGLQTKKYLDGETDIDLLAPDYSVLENVPYYAANETYYGYTSRGCTNKCPWCGVPKIEPKYNRYIDIKPMIRQMRKEY